MGIVISTQVTMPLESCRNAMTGDRPSVRSIWSVIATVSGMTRATMTAVAAKPAILSVLPSWYQAAISAAESFGDWGGRIPVAEHRDQGEDREQVSAGRAPQLRLEEGGRHTERLYIVS